MRNNEALEKLLGKELEWDKTRLPVVDAVKEIYNPKAGKAMENFLTHVKEVEVEGSGVESKGKEEDLKAALKGTIDIAGTFSQEKLAKIRVLVAGPSHETAPNAIAIYIKHPKLDGEVGIKIAANAWMQVRLTGMSLTKPEEKKAYAEVLNFLKGRKIMKVVQSLSRKGNQISFEGITETRQFPASF